MPCCLQPFSEKMQIAWASKEGKWSARSIHGYTFLVGSDLIPTLWKEACAGPGGAEPMGQTAGSAPTKASLTDFKTLFLTARVTDLLLKLPVMKWRTQKHLIVEHIKGSIFKIKKIGQTVESITIFKGIYRAVVDESFGIVSLSQCLNWFLHCTVFSFKMCASLNNYIHIKNQHFFAST